MPESDKGTLEDRKQDDCEKVQAILMDTLHLEVDIENVFRLGILSRERRKARPIRFSVGTLEDKRKVLDAARNLKNNVDHPNVSISPDLTNGQRKAAFQQREERRRRIADGEEYLVIRRGKIVKPAPRQEAQDTGDHNYVNRQERDKPVLATQERGRSAVRGRLSGSRSPPWCRPGRWNFSLMTLYQINQHVYTLTVL